MKPSLAIAMLALGVSTAAQAQSRSHVGPQIGYNFDWEALVIGAQFSAPLSPALEFYPSFNYFFVENGTVFAVNADIKYRMPMESANWLYLGGGLNLTRVKFGGGSSTDAHVNLLAGVEKRSGNVHPFGEVRLTIGDGSTVQLVAGLNFTMRGHQ